jgi:hypothetical protein
LGQPTCLFNKSFIKRQGCHFKIFSLVLKQGWKVEGGGGGLKMLYAISFIIMCSMQSPISYKKCYYNLQLSYYLVKCSGVYINALLKFSLLFSHYLYHRHQNDFYTRIAKNQNILCSVINSVHLCDNNCSCWCGHSRDRREQ